MECVNDAAACLLLRACLLLGVIVAACCYHGPAKHVDFIIRRLEIYVDLRLFDTSMAKTLRKLLKGLMLQDYAEYMGYATRVVLGPSLRDAYHDFVFPQPVFDIHSDLKNQITHLTNPRLFNANKVKRLVFAHLCEKA